MRILIVTPFHFSRSGGIEQYSKEIAHEFRHAGHRTSFWFADGSSEERASNRQFAIAGRLPMPRIGWFFGRRSLRNSIHDSDAVIIQSHLFLSSLIALAFSRNKRVVLIDHSSGFLSDRRKTVQALLRRWETFSLTAIKASRVPVATVSVAGERWMSDFGIKVKGVARNSIRIPEKEPRSKPEEKQPFSACFVGRLVEGKGLDTAIEIFNRVKELHPSFTLDVVGDGPKKVLIPPPEAQTGIRHHGDLDRVDVQRILARSQFFLFPTEYPEGLPTVLLEAGANHCIPIVSNFASVREVIENSDHGVICTCVEEFVRQIDDFICDAAKREHVSASFHNHLRANFSWKACSNFLLRTLAE